MRKVLGPIAVIVIILVLLGVMLVPSYNKFVTLEENVDQAYAQVENQLQRRMDLIPNLVNTVKGFASHEKEMYLVIFRMHVQDWRGRQVRKNRQMRMLHCHGALEQTSSRCGKLSGFESK